MLKKTLVLVLALLLFQFPTVATTSVDEKICFYDLDFDSIDLHTYDWRTVDFTLALELTSSDYSLAELHDILEQYWSDPDAAINSTCSHPTVTNPVCMGVHVPMQNTCTMVMCLREYRCIICLQELSLIALCIDNAAACLLALSD